MPVRPSPCVCKCPACHWLKVVWPRSDALQTGDYYTACPKCGNEHLKSFPLPRPRTNGLFAHLLQILSGRR